MITNMSILNLKKEESLYAAIENLYAILYNNKLKIAEIFEFKKGRYYKGELNKLFVIENVQMKDIFKNLYELKKDEILKNRANGILGKEIDIFITKENDKIEEVSTCDMYISLLSSNEILPKKAKIIEVFDSPKVVNEIIEETRNIEEDDNIYYGFWNIKEDDICSCFIYKSLVQSIICFPDLGENSLKEGSLFFKMRIE